MHLIAHHRKTAYVIALDRRASRPERHAADELAEHLRLITGARFRIATPSAAAGTPCLAVGPGAAVAAGLPESAFRGLGDEGLVVRSVRRNIVFTGAPGSSRGTLYAVSVFLEEELGCRWWTPQASTIPRHDRLDVPTQQRRVIPRFEYRESLYKANWDTRWCVRNRTNGLWETPPGGIQAEWGGHRKHMGFVHTFSSLVPPDPFFKEHPDWFAEVNGTRTQEQLCLTNPDVAKYVSGRVKAWLRATPDANIVSVSQNDNHVHCLCPTCRALDRHEGSPSGSLLHFVNRVAQAVEKEFPQVAVDTLAYLYSRRPPRHVRPRQNVVVRLCSFECDFLHPMTHVNNTAFRSDIRKWSAICRRLYVWDYVTNFAHFAQPHPNWFVLGDNVRFFARNHVRGLFEQGNHQSPGGEMGYLRAWVLAKLLWNQSLDTEALVHEFLQGYYGRAAIHLETYLRLVHSRAMSIPYFPGSTAIQECLLKRGLPQCRAGCYLDLNAPVEAPFLDPDTVLEATRHFEAALCAVAGDAELSSRVVLARLPVWYVILIRWNEIRRHARATRQGWMLPEKRTAACRAFARVCRTNGITHLGEGWSHRDLPWLARVCEGRQKP